ncbi:MAG: 3-phosphoshikimate 1-carboxyvinyltransferase, partial [Gemmatimonadaceae bacterium]
EDKRVRLHASDRLEPLDVDVPADPSSAAFLAGLAALADDGEILLESVCVNPTRTGFFEVLRRMGAEVEELERRDAGGEPVATLRVRASSLHGVRIGGEIIPSLIDEIPLLACIASRAEGETLIEGAEELRVKESDRIATVVDNLRRAGAEIEELPDGMRIVGRRTALSGTVSTRADHRIAMAFGVLGALPGNALTIDDPSCVAVSYPSFWTDLHRVIRA